MKKFTCIIFFVLSILIANAQWQPTNGPAVFGGDISCFADNGTIAFVGTFGNGLFTSNDSGKTLKGINGLGPDVYSIGFFGNTILVGRNNFGISRSTDNGATWSPSNT